VARIAEALGNALYRQVDHRQQFFRPSAPNRIDDVLEAHVLLGQPALQGLP